MTIEEFVPKTKNGIDGLGFLFGAGTSFESGYPLVSGLTSSVIGALKDEDKNSLEEVLAVGNEKGNQPVPANPNIEEISDLVVEHAINSGKERFNLLKENIRTLISDAILSVSNPDLTNQVAFFEALKARSYDRATTVWVFTTNYDLLFEDAAAEAGVKIVNGFSGATSRFFSEKEFVLVHGTTKDRRFIDDNCLTVRLVKLHGSVSWYKKESRVFERAPQQILDEHQRCMVLPRRTKVFETLSPPYDRLFAISSGIIGSAAKHMISSGFSFSDDHINDTLVTPKLSNGAIFLANFCEYEPKSLANTRLRPNVIHVCKDKTIVGGKETVVPSEYWKFSEFIKLF